MRVDVCKIGKSHVFEDQNNQDFVLSLPNAKMVFDGCGSGKFSEIGSRLFAELLMFQKDEITIETFTSIVHETFQKLKDSFKGLVGEKNIDRFLKHNLSFTILACFETETEYIVYTAGDGFILLDAEEEFYYDILDDGEYPAYYVYNFMEDKSVLAAYQNGVNFHIHRYSKEEWKNVGVATDGFRFIEELNDAEINHLVAALSEGKKGLVEKIINRNCDVFKDDISICM